MLEPIENQFMQIGRIARSHGLSGDVLIIPDIGVPELFDELELVNLQNSRGDLFPVRVEEVRVDMKNNRLSFFVKFDRITDRNQAEELKGSPVYADRETVEGLMEVTESPERFSQFQVIDEEDQPVGRVERVLDNPAHPILQIHTDDHRRLLVPFVDEYIVESDEDEEIIRCRNLDQLTGISE